MKARGKKQLLGWLGSRFKGGRLAQLDISPRVQSPREDGHEQAMDMWLVLVACMGSREAAWRVLDWADTTDGAGTILTAAEGEARDEFCGYAKERGWYDPYPSNPPKTEDIVWETLPDQIRQRTRRLLET